ncbi:MAG: hypothetical protein ABIF19_02680 [Planctomycetota bacterium]
MRRTLKRIVRKTARLTAALCITALLSILPRPVEAAERAGGQARGDSNPQVRLGEFPPDFELPRLTFRTDADGKSVGVISEDETVRLSAFRGKRPVCMIMSSYT